jgi:hypothetical protein
MIDVHMRPGCPVLHTGRYEARASNGLVLRQLYLPAGIAFPPLAGVAYYAPVGVLQADC